MPELLSDGRILDQIVRIRGGGIAPYGFDKRQQRAGDIDRLVPEVAEGLKE